MNKNIQYFMMIFHKRVLQEVGNTGTGMDGSPILKRSAYYMNCLKKN